MFHQNGCSDSQGLKSAWPAVKSQTFQERHTEDSTTAAASVSSQWLSPLMFLSFLPLTEQSTREELRVKYGALADVLPVNVAHIHYYNN